MPTPLRLVRVAIACSTLGSFRKAFLLSDWTAFGVLIRTKFVSWGKNFPRWMRKRNERKERNGKEEK